MAATKIGVVYATGSGILRRWIVPDRDADLIARHSVGAGESMILLDRANVPGDPVQAQAFIEAAIGRVTGKAVPSPRCAIVDAGGTVVGTVMADPAIDHIPNCTLVLHPTADRGWKVRDAVLVDVVAEAAAAAAAAAKANAALIVEALP
jgi:hypothetical protein